MDWIKKNTDQFALAVLAFILLALSVLIILKCLNFKDSFSAIQTTPPRNDTIPGVPMDVIAAAEQSVRQPAQWIPKGPAGAKDAGSLFVSEPYFVEDGRLKLLDKGGTNFPPIPNGWLSKYGLSLLNPAVVTDDPDRDGFPNLVEYLGASRVPESTNPQGDADSTNPTDPNSHPPYYTLLSVKEWKRVRFRLVFKIYNGDPGKPDTLDFQINTLDRTGPTQFYKLGQSIEGTKYRFDKFEHKTRKNPSTGADEDVSELTLTNTETNESVILPLNMVVNSPDSIALFYYAFPPAQEMPVRRGQEFALRPNLNERYKLIDINEKEAVIVLPSGEKYSVPYLK
jgi:hypothetical protein